MMKIKLVVCCEIAFLFIMSSCCREKQYQYYPNGSVLSEYWLRNGKLVGDFVSYYEDGQRSITSKYFNGKQHGECISNYTNGNIRSSEIYRFGKLVSLNIWDSNGVVVVKDGCGNGTIHFPSGDIMSISYLNGLPDGNQITWDSAGMKKTESVYEHGVLLKSFEWNSDGIMKFSSELFFSNDTVFYIHRNYYDNGLIHYESRMMDNVEVGIKHIWDEEGNLISK